VKTRKIIAALVAAFMFVAASAVPAQAAKKPAKTYNFKVTGTVSGAAGKDCTFGCRYRASLGFAINC
jgi:uncharacterized membrane protein